MFLKSTPASDQLADGGLKPKTYNLPPKTYNLKPNSFPLQPKTYNLKPNWAFTLMEFVVIIAVVGILSVLIFKSTETSRDRSRNTKRMQDVKQMRESLELYFNSEQAYPTAWVPGQPLISPTNGKTFLEAMPYNPKPSDGGPCSANEYAYTTLTSTYNINYCLTDNTGDITAGSRIADGNSLNAAAPINYITPLLLHMNGADQDTAFTESSNNLTITKYGSTKTVAATKKFGTASAYFNGTTDYLEASAADTATYFNFLNSSFTIDWWEYRTSATSGKTSFSTAGLYSGLGYQGLMGGYSDGSALRVYADSGANSWDIANNKTLGSISLNQWVHLAIVRSGNTFYLFKNGTQTDTWTSSGALKDMNAVMYENIGYLNKAGSNFMATCHSWDGTCYSAYADPLTACQSKWPSTTSVSPVYTGCVGTCTCSGNSGACGPGTTYYCLSSNRLYHRFTLGMYYSTGYLFQGYIDEFRVSTVARWTANFTPPTLEY